MHKQYCDNCEKEIKEGYYSINFYNHSNEDDPWISFGDYCIDCMKENVKTGFLKSNNK